MKRVDMRAAPHWGEARRTALHSCFRSTFNSHAYVPVDGHCLISTGGWVPDRYFHCLHHMRFVTVDNDDDDGSETGDG